MSVAAHAVCMSEASLLFLNLLADSQEILYESLGLEANGCQTSTSLSSTTGPSAEQLRIISDLYDKDCT
jgi:hypothetical protein